MILLVKFESKIIKDDSHIRIMTSEYNDLALIEQTVKEIAELDIERAQPAVSSLLESLTPSEKNTAFGLLLKSFWSHCESLRVARNEKDWQKAIILMEQAVDGFKQLEQHQLVAMSTGFVNYFHAILELYSHNISRSRMLFDATIEYLEKAGAFGQKYRHIVDHMRPEALYVAGLQALQALETNSGSALIDQAANASLKLADNYYDEGSKGHATYVGLGYLYRAHFTLIRTWLDLDHFDYHQLSRAKNLEADAIEAKYTLERGDLENANILAAYHLSDGIAKCLAVIPKLARILEEIFKSTFKMDFDAIVQMRFQIKEAKVSFSKAGSSGVLLSKSLDILLIKIDNIEKLVKPHAKDFGIYSGLVGAVAFLPLFIVTSWANDVFEVKVTPYLLFFSCLVVALIAGFGFGALRFKSILPWRQNSNTAKEAATE